MFNNSVSRIIDITNISDKKEKYNILTFPTHERYETQLCKTNHNFYAFNHSKMKQWNTEQTEIPINYHILPEEQLCSYINYDFILIQSKFGQFQLAMQINQKLNLPIICLEHTTPTPQTISSEQLASMKEMSGHVNVFISEYSKKSWGIDGLVINHGIDTSLFSPTEQAKEDIVLTVANDFINRDYCLNYGGWKRVTDKFKTKVVGDTKGLSNPAKTIEELVSYYNNCAIYFNSTTLSPIPMSLLEAMSCGCAIVSTATCMIPEIIKHEYNGYISNSEEELKQYIQFLLDNPEERKKIGNNARQTILEQFSETKFINSWNNLFNRLYEVSTI